MIYKHSLLHTHVKYYWFNVYELSGLLSTICEWGFYEMVYTNWIKDMSK